MKTFAAYFSKELPRINQYLESILNDLPSSVQEIAAHVILSGGKRLRPLLLVLFASVLGCKKESVYSLAAAFELLHSASLLHDDILDQAQSRRKKTAAHLVFGVNKTVLAGDALFARASSLVAAENNLQMMICFAEAMEKTVTAEIQELELLNRPDVSMNDYLEVITGKTAYLIQACCEFGVLAADGNLRQLRAAKVYGLNIGIAFQLVDDALDYSAAEDISGKPQGGDLREGKLTLPLIFYLNNLSAAEKMNFWEELKQGFSQQRLQELLQDINTQNYPQRTRQTARKYLEIAARELEIFPSGEVREVLREIIEFIWRREK